METCKLQYSERAGWKYMYWTVDDVISLVKKHRPEYMAVGRLDPREGPCSLALFLSFVCSFVPLMPDDSECPLALPLEASPNVTRCMAGVCHPA